VKRRREQKGTVYKKCGMWYLRYSDFRVIDGELQRKRLAKQLGAVDEMTRQKARDEAKNFLAGINKPTLQPETAVTLINFVEKVYFPRIEQRLRPSTLRSYRVEWDAQLKPYCGGLWTRDVRTREAQAILDTMAATERFNVCSLQRLRVFCPGYSGLRSNRATMTERTLFAKPLSRQSGARRKHTLIHCQKS